MRIRLHKLRVTCHESVETIVFARQVTFIHGPVSTGKSTTARLIDFCFGGSLEQTPALRSEFLSAELSAEVGSYSVLFERNATQNASVRLTWEGPDNDIGSVTAPFAASPDPIIDADVFSFSDLVFHLAGVEPIKVRKSKRDPDSPLVRLSFRDLLWYCYLDQDHLDSSFYRMEDTFKRNKSMDVMRFVVGFHSERLNELDQRIAAAQDQIRANRAAADQIRAFLKRFELGTEVELDVALQQLESEIDALKVRRGQIESDHLASTHSVEPLRQELRELVLHLRASGEAIQDVAERVSQHESLRAELIAAKVKSARIESASTVFEGVSFARCPQCGRDIALEGHDPECCTLCGQGGVVDDSRMPARASILREDINTRIEELDELVSRHREELADAEDNIASLERRKKELDDRLTVELQRYDSAYVSEVRRIDSSIAELEERQASFRRLAELPRALVGMEEEAGRLQGELRSLRESYVAEQRRLARANDNVGAVETAFKEIMLDIGFPGLSEEDRVEIDRRTWQPKVYHGDDDENGWNFFEAGSGGKKVLFNVCYALALHRVSADRGLPLPTLLIVDSPTKNISPDVNPSLITAYFKLIYSLAAGSLAETQFVLVDSELVEPEDGQVEFVERLMKNDDENNPPLISYYSGP